MTSRLRGVVSVVASIAVVLALGYWTQQRHDKAQSQVQTDAVNVAADVGATVGLVVDTFPSVDHHKAAAVPDVLVRVGFTVNQGTHLVPTDWCRNNKDSCMSALKNRFANAATSNPSSNPSPHANDNMRRVYLNSFNINPKAGCDALCSYNHYRDDVNKPGGYCQMGWRVSDPHSIGQAAFPACHQVAWGGPDGSDAGTNFDVQDKGFVVCAGTVLGTAAGEVVFTGGAAAPAAGVTVGAGTFGCGVGWALAKWLF